MLFFTISWLLILSHALLGFWSTYFRRMGQGMTIVLATVQLGAFLYHAYHTHMVNMHAAPISLGKIMTIGHLPELSWMIDPAGLAFAGMISLLWWVTSIYMHGYARSHALPGVSRFYCWMQCSVAIALLMAFAANLFTLFIGYELLTIATTFLVLHRGTDGAVRAGRYYLMLLLGSSLLLFMPLVVWVYLCGAGDFVLGGHLAELQEPSWLPAILLVAATYGVGKAAMWPLQGWLPRAMVAEAPVSALLHAVAVVKAGIFCLLRLYYFIFGEAMLKELPNVPFLGGTFIGYIAIITMLYAGVMAWRQTQFKPLLAYSTVGQLAFCVAILSVGDTDLILPAALLYMFCHAVAKISLFFVAGVLSIHHPKLLLVDFAGLGRRMPLTMLLLTVSALSIMGMPMLPGYYGKEMLIDLVLHAEHHALLAGILLSSLITILYFGRLLWRIWFQPQPAIAFAPITITCRITFFLCLALLLGASCVFFWSDTELFLKGCHPELVSGSPAT